MGGILDLTSLEPTWDRRIELGLSLLNAQADGSGTFHDGRGRWQLGTGHDLRANLLLSRDTLDFADLGDDELREFRRNPSGFLSDLSDSSDPIGKARLSRGLSRRRREGARAAAAGSRD